MAEVCLSRGEPLANRLHCPSFQSTGIKRRRAPGVLDGPNWMAE